LEKVPVVADESARTLADVDRIIASGAADVINVKFMKFGGVTGSGVAVAKAQEAGLGVLVGSMMEHPHSVAAAVHFAASLGGVHDLDAGWWAQDTSPLHYADGFVSTVAQ
jgi:L-Ala-D/L-Glu epimerase